MEGSCGSSDKGHDGSDDDDHQLFSNLAPPRPQDLIATPGKMDVICGRGKSVTHPGNQRFRKLITDRKKDYQSSRRRDDKTRITAEIVDTLRRGPQPSRFLLRCPDTNMWVDVGEMYAREKVSHALRSRPSDERQRRPKPKKKASRKPQISTELENTVTSLIEDQQQLLKALIAKEICPGGHAGF